MNKLACALALFLVGGTAFADDASRAKAAQVVNEIVPKSQYDKMMKLMVDQLTPMLAAQQIDIAPADLTKAMSDLMPYSWVASMNVDVYAKRFTAKELDDVLAFYRTPTGKKMAQQLPEISADVNLVIQHRIQEKLPALMQELSQKKKK